MTVEVLLKLPPYGDLEHAKKKSIAIMEVFLWLRGALLDK
jgi:hypothetical protein